MTADLLKSLGAIPYNFHKIDVGVLIIDFQRKRKPVRTHLILAVEQLTPTVVEVYTLELSSGLTGLFWYGDGVEEDEDWLWMVIP